MSHCNAEKENEDVLVRTVTKAGMCEFIEYQPVNECTFDSDNDNVDREISGSLVNRELWSAEREGKKIKESSPMTHAVGNKRFSKIFSEEKLAAMSRGITIPNTEKTTNWAVKNFDEWKKNRNCCCHEDPIPEDILLSHDKKLLSNIFLNL